MTDSIPTAETSDYRIVRTVSPRTARRRGGAMTAPLRVGAFYVQERRTHEGAIYPRVDLVVYEDGFGEQEMLRVAVVLPPREPRLAWGIVRETADPDLVECFGLALDRAAGILREAQA